MLCYHQSKRVCVIHRSTDDAYDIQIHLNKVKANKYFASYSTPSLWLNFLWNLKHSLGFALLPKFNFAFASEICSPCIFCTAYFLWPCPFLLSTLILSFHSFPYWQLVPRFFFPLLGEITVSVTWRSFPWSVSPEPTSEHFPTFVLCCLALFTGVEVEAASSLLVVIVLITRWMTSRCTKGHLG